MSRRRRDEGYDEDLYDEDQYGGEEEEDRGRRAGRSRRGFAAMPKEKVRAIAAKGGRATGKRKRGGEEDYDDIQEDLDARRRRRREEEESRRHGFFELDEETFGEDYDLGPARRVRRMYERGERPRRSLREEDMGVASEEEELSREDRMGYYGRGSRKGFAAMPKERVREIARKGGRHSHGFKKKARYSFEGGGMEEVPAEEEERGGYYKVGFAKMPKERVREIGRKGGRRSHGYGDRYEDERYDLGEEDEEDYPMLGRSTGRRGVY